MLFSNTYNNISHVKLLLRDWKDEQMLVRKFLLLSSKQKKRELPLVPVVYNFLMNKVFP